MSEPTAGEHTVLGASRWLDAGATELDDDRRGAATTGGRVRSQRAALLCRSLVALAWLLNGRGLSPPASAGLVAVVATSAAAFVWRELRHPDPVLNLRLFRHGP